MDDDMYVCVCFSTDKVGGGEGGGGLVLVQP
jgi:hypothetical protein